MPIMLPIVVARPASVVRRSAVRNVEGIGLTLAEEVKAVKRDISHKNSNYERISLKKFPSPLTGEGRVRVNPNPHRKGIKSPLFGK